MTAPISCLSCAHAWNQGPEPITGCPQCGGTNLSVRFVETIAATDEVQYVGRNAAGKRVLKGHARRSITKDGAQAGTFAWLEQMVDKARKRYKKKVTLANGEIVKDVDGPLADQSFHGPQPASDVSDDQPAPDRR